MASGSQSMSQLASSGTSILRRRPKGQGASTQQGNEAQGATTTVQQDVPSATASTMVVFTPDRTITDTDASQEHGESNADASFLSEVSGQTPRFIHEASSHRSPTIAGPIPEQAATNDTDLLGMLIPTPSPPRAMQSTETHQPQQSLRQNANEQIRARGITHNDNDGASALDVVNLNARRRSPLHLRWKLF